MSPEALVLALTSVVRPTSAAAVYAMLSTDRAARLLLAYLLAGLAFTLVIGVGAVNLLVPVTRAQAPEAARTVLDLVLGTAALGYAAGMLSGVVQRRERRPEPHGRSWITDRLSNLSLSGAAVLGVLTHLPGLFYLAALKTAGRLNQMAL
jgi:hypothetical protein